MPLFDTGKQRAALAILLLAFGLVVAIAPYATGLLGAPVLYVLFSPLHRWLARKLPASVAAAIVIGAGVTALVQGVMIGSGFALTGLGDPLFWGVVTTVFSILPVVGSGLVWVPAAISLAIDDNTVGAIGLAVVGLLAGQ